MDIKKLMLGVILTGSIWNTFCATPAQLTPAQEAMLEPYINDFFTQKISSLSGASCNIQAATDAFNCLQNTCIGHGSVPTIDNLLANGPSQSNCYSNGCASTTCPLSSDQFAQLWFLSPSSIEGSIGVCIDDTTKKQVPC